MNQSSLDLYMRPLCNNPTEITGPLVAQFVGKLGKPNPHCLVIVVQLQDPNLVVNLQQQVVVSRESSFVCVWRVGSLWVVCVWLPVVLWPDCVMVSSDYESRPCHDPPFSSWEKVTRKMVDPITFSCRFNITYVPRIEDCSYETTTVAIGEPRFGEPRKRETTTGRGSSSSQSSTRKSLVNHDDNAWRPHDFSNSDPNNSSNTSKSKNHTQNMVKPSKNHVKPTKSGGTVDKGASLGAFFSKDAVKKVIDFDNQSMGSRSMNSRSVSERSNAERSKAEEKIKLRRVHRPTMDGTSNPPEIKGMMSIDEQNAAEFSERKSRGGMLEQFLNDTSVPTSTFIEVDNQSLMSASTIGTRSVSLMSVTDRSKQEKMLKSTLDSKNKDSGEKASRLSDANSKNAKSNKPPLVLKSILKKHSSTTNNNIKRKLEIKEGHDICEVPTLSDKEYYADWDDIWYSEDEIGDMRYAAFLEEAGLDVDEYMNMS